MIMPLTSAKAAAVALVAILIGLCALFFNLWRGEVNSFADYRAEVVAAGKAQEAEVERITTEQKQITEETTNGWKAALDITRAQYAGAVRVRKPSGSCEMPGISQPAARTDEASDDTVPSSASLEKACAEVTLSLNFLQDWIERQKKAAQ